MKVSFAVLLFLASSSIMEGSHAVKLAKDRDMNNREILSMIDKDDTSNEQIAAKEKMAQ